MSDSIKNGADHVMAQLSDEDIQYASDPERGEYRGFAALHDLYDANMLLPGRGDEEMADLSEAALYRAIAIQDEVTRRICGTVATPIRIMTRPGSGVGETIIDILDVPTDVGGLITLRRHGNTLIVDVHDLDPTMGIEIDGITVRKATS